MSFFVSLASFASGIEIYPCPAESKDPVCYRNKPIFDEGKLSCSSHGKVLFTSFHGVGSGCGESGKLIIVKQTRDWASKTILVETKWHPGKVAMGEYGACHYYGPIYGGGSIDTFIGKWKVIVDGKYVGSYTYDINTEQISENESYYTQSCKIDIALDHEL